MARPQSSDFLHNMRFHVELEAAGQRKWLQEIGRDGVNTLTTPAGFSSCTTPTLQVSPAAYKEGTMIYARKQPGEPTMGGPVSLTRGIARMDSSFWLWLRSIAEGSGEYRADLQIKHYHRENALVRPHDQRFDGSTRGKTSIPVDAIPAKTYHVFEAWPVSGSPAGTGLDATNGEISIMQLDLEYEHFDIQDHQAT